MSNSILAAAAAAALLAALPALPQERKIKPRDVPAPVAAAAAKAFPNAKLKGWETNVKDGKTYYEAAVAEGAAKRQAVFSAEGPLVEVEEAVAVASVPAAVAAAVRAKYPGAVIRGAERITRGSEVEYELALRKAAVKEMVVAADGRIAP